MRSLPRLLLAAFALGVAERPSAYGQDVNPTTGVPNPNGVSVIANGAAAPNAQAGTYGATVLPMQAPDGGPPITEALGPGGGELLPRFMPRVGVTYLAGEALGVRGDGFSAIEAWIPLQIGEAHQLMFADMRGIVDNYSRVGANIGVGYRSYNRERDRVNGIYGYYDYRDTGVARYNQLSFGFESLGRYYDYRANVYIPFNDDVSTVSDVFDCLNPRLFGNFMLLTRRLERESAMRGADAEFGFPLLQALRTKGFLGAYFFDGREVEQVYGVRGRLECQATENIHLQITAQTDNVFGENVWGGMTVTFPGPSRRYGDEDILHRLNDAVMRNYNIVTARDVRITEEAATSTASGQPLRIVFVDDSAAAGGDGTTEAPFNNFAEAQAGSLPGDIIFVRSGTYVGQNIVLQNDQRFLGDGVPAPVPGDPCLAGGFLIASVQCPDGFLLPGSRNPADRPNIINAPGDAITLASRNEVGGFNIIGSGNSAIAGNGGQSFNIHDVTIAQSGGSGIRLVDYSGFGAIRNVISTQNGGRGVSVINNTGTVTLDIRCLTATLNGGDGVTLATNTGNIDATIFNSDMNNNDGSGLNATASGGGSISMNIQSSRFNANAVHGAVLNAADGTLDATISNSTFNANDGLGTSAGLLFLVGDGAAIPVSSGDSTIAITNSSFNNNEGSGIQGRVDGGASTLNFTMIGSIADANLAAGVSLNVQDGVNTLTLLGNALTNNSQNGFAFSGFGASSTTAAFTGNFIVGNGFDPFAPANLRDGVLLQSFTTSANALTATFTGNTIVNNGGPTGAGPRGHGVNIVAFNIGTTTAGADVSFSGDNISFNQESGIRALIGGGNDAANPLNATITVADGTTVDFNGLDGVTIDNNQFGSLLATFDDSFFRNNGVNGIFIANVSLAAGEAPHLETRIQRNVINDNGFATPGVFTAAGINIQSAGRNANPNLININDNASIARNNIGIFVNSGVRTATSITNHRNVLNNQPRIFDNADAGVVLFSIYTAGTIPTDRTEVHDVRINNNVISSPSEAIVLLTLGGDPVNGIAGGRMDAHVTQNLLVGPGFVPTVGLALFGPPPALTANRAIENARFLAISGGARSFMRVKLEQNNVNDLQYNFVNAGPVVTAPGNTDGSLFDIASSATTNQGFSNPILAPEFFGPNTGVYGFANGGTGIIDSLIAPPPSTAFGADFDPTQSNILINVVFPPAITPGPFPPPP
jgi:hypothetical protein